MGAAALAAIEGFVREPQHPVGEEIEIRLKRLPEAFDGFRIAQISDIHFGPYLDRQGVERGVQLAQGMHPDLLVLTGDLVSHSIGKANGLDGARARQTLCEM
jgi:predicted MPP superfamily phosphohydrolase